VQVEDIMYWNVLNNGGWGERSKGE
jgi:hypothetical protein